jgi:hypothetical protein
VTAPRERREWRMRQCLVVGNQSLPGGHVQTVVSELAAQQPSRFHIVVPATPPSQNERDLLRSEHVTHLHGEAAGFALARSVLRTVLARWQQSGLHVSGEVGAPAPFEAVRDALAGRRWDLLIVSTLAPRRSRWLAARLPARLRAAHGIPVLHVEPPPDGVGTVESGLLTTR